MMSTSGVIHHAVPPLRSCPRHVIVDFASRPQAHRSSRDTAVMRCLVLKRHAQGRSGVMYFLSVFTRAHKWLFFAAISAVTLSACSGQNSPGPANSVPAHSHQASVGVAQPVIMRLSDGETVTIQPGSEPPIVPPNQIPAAILTAVRNHQDLSMGQFHAVVEHDDMSWAANLPPPSDGSDLGASIGNSARRPNAVHSQSATGGSADHSTNGWYVDGYDSNPNYQSEGYVQFNADMGLPTLYPEPSSATCSTYVYYAPTTQGIDGNPLEVGLARRVRIGRMPGPNTCSSMTGPRTAAMSRAINRVMVRAWDLPRTRQPSTLHLHRNMCACFLTACRNGP